MHQFPKLVIVGVQYLVHLTEQFGRVVFVNFLLRLFGMQICRVDRIALLKASVIGSAVDRVRCLIAKLTPTDLDATLDEVLALGIPQPDVRQ